MLTPGVIPIEMSFLRVVSSWGLQEVTIPLSPGFINSNEERVRVKPCLNI